LERLAKPGLADRKPLVRRELLRSCQEFLDPWWLAAQLFIRWAKRGVRERLLDLAQQPGIALGMTFLDGTSIRAHHQAAGAKRGDVTASSEIVVKHLALARRLRHESPGERRRRHGRAIAVALAPGPAHELPLAPGLPGCLPDVPGWIVGDRGFASDALRHSHAGGRTVDTAEGKLLVAGVGDVLAAMK
jgi:hypothetical protein